jgi:hypothetical protein
MLKVRRPACLLAVLLLFQTTAHAWGDTGHMVVAQIALQNLTGTVAQRNAKIARLNALAAMLQFRQNNYDFATSAVWMDDLRGDHSHELLRDWHFITLRFFDGVPPLNRPTPPVNVVSTIREMQQMLFDDDFDSDERRAYYVAVMTHLVGDIHQPLHCATRYSPTHRDGDAGGNFFRLSGSPDNLHSYWDGAGGNFPTELEAPLNQNERQLLAQYAANIMQEFPRSQFTQKLTQLDPQTWATESHQLARTEAHQGIQENTAPNAAYQTKTRRLSRERIALAGYRLAQIVDRVRLTPGP